MPYGTKSVGFAVNVSSVSEYRGKPQRHSLVNRFDEHGDLYSLDRLPGETNTAFKKRIMDLTLHPGGPNYEGLLNNLARELGCPREPALTIDLKRDASSGSVLAPNPRVDILADRVVLYYDWKDYDSFSVDREIDFYDLGSSGYFLSGLINEINKSSYFVAVADRDVRLSLHSTNIVRGSSFGRVVDDVIKADGLTILSAQNIVEGSMWFSEKDIFVTEVQKEPSTDGEYRIDYANGLLYTYSLPSGRGSCGYYYAGFPMEVDASLIHVYSLHDDNYVKKLFRQEALPSGDEQNALPNTEGAEVFHQLFKETEVLWGE